MGWRKLIVAATLAVIYFCPGVGSAARSAAPERSLRDVAQDSGILIGTAVRPAHLSEQDYATTLAREFNLAEPEDALKWEVVHPEEQRFDFSQADQVVDFAERHDMKVRGHTLVWHQQNPKWLTDGKFSSAELAAILEKHIKTVVDHYRGKIFAWDVANEAFDELHPGELRSTIWRDQPGIGSGSGTSYLARCFRWAHEADPQALLFYNEAEAETVNAKSDAIYAMVRDFRARGVPIDGVGFEMHVSNLQIDAASIAENISRFTALGVQVHITELDVALPVGLKGDPHAGEARPEALHQQAEIYRQLARICLSHPGCTAIQTWGFTDKYSWIGSHSKQREGAALPFDREYRPKPAYQALNTTLKTAVKPR